VALRIVVGDDNLLVREGVSKLLAADSDVEVVADAADLPSLRDACDREEPDVVITDIRMPPSHTDEGIQFAAELRDRHPQIGVVVLSHYADPLYAVALLDRGSDGRAYLLKERVRNRAELTAAVRAVAAGGSVIDAKIVEPLALARGRAEQSPLKDLTPRERQVLAEIAQGKSNVATAESLGISKHAVERNLHEVFVKFNLGDEETVNKRVKAVLMFLTLPGGADPTVGRWGVTADR
jgi:DNA-binding NarL/FixJ family response regulator